MKRTIALLLAGMLLCLCACTGGTASKGGSGIWVSYTEAGSTVKNEENKDVFVYSYQQPTISGEADGVHVINTKLDNATTAFLYGSGGVEEMTALAKMDWKEAWFTCYALEREVSVARIDETVASFRYSDYVFNGGVHGNTYEYGMTYDMVSGEHLTLAALAADETALRAVCRQHILAELNAEDYPHRDELNSDYANNVDSVLKNWVLTNEGLQFIAQPYVISSYTLGTLRFTVPYEKLAHVLYDKWIPAEQGHGGGSISVTTVDSENPAATNFVTDADGTNVVVKVNGRVYDVSVEQINSYQQSGQTMYYIVKQLLYSPQLSSESFGLKVQVPDTLPTALLRYKDGSGTEYQYLISYNGKNGGVDLVELETYLERE